MSLIIAGKIAAIKSNGKSKKILQFIATDPDGNVRLDVVHLEDASQYRLGQEVEIPVAPSVFNKQTKQIEFVAFDETTAMPATRHSANGIGAGMQ